MTRVMREKLLTSFLKFKLFTWTLWSKIISVVWTKSWDNRWKKKDSPKKKLSKKEMKIQKFWKMLKRNIRKKHQKMTRKKYSEIKKKQNFKKGKRWLKRKEIEGKNVIKIIIIIDETIPYHIKISKKNQNINEKDR